MTCSIESLAALAADAVWYRQRKLNLLLRTAQVSDGYAVFYASDEADSAARPKLIVDYLAAPGLQIADHGDGSGATATLGDVDGDTQARSTSAALAAKLEQPVTGSPLPAQAAATWCSNLPPGHYFAYASTAIGTHQLTSPVVYFIVTDGLEAIHARCLDAVQVRIRMLLLDGLSDERIIVEKLPIARNLGTDVELPAIVLSPQRATPADAGTNGADDVALRRAGDDHRSRQPGADAGGAA